MRRNTTVIVSLLTVLAPLSLLAQAESGGATDPYGLAEEFVDHELHLWSPDAMKEDLADGRVTLTLFGVERELVLTDARIPTPSLGRLLEDGGVVIEPPAYQNAVWTGAIAGDAGSHATIIVTASGVSGNVQPTDADVVAFEPVRFLDPLAPPGLSVAYRVADIRDQSLPHDHLVGEIGEGTRPDVGVAAPPDRIATLWADLQMYQWSSSWSDVVFDTFATVQTEYDRTTSTYPGWTFSIAQNTVYYCNNTSCNNAWGMGSSDPYTLIVDWGNMVRHNSAVGTNFHVAHLFSGKSFAGNVLGLGYQPGRISIGEYPSLNSWSRSLLAGHEIGHNFNGDHGLRGIPSPGRATSYTHQHSQQVFVCDHPQVLGICLLGHTETQYTTYTHYTLMWPSLVGTSGTNEQLFELGNTNRQWMRNCNEYSHNSGGYTAGAGGFGYYCNN